ncbi:amidohydrolase [Leifsonia shinshuensis]|uniref:Peptidase M20 domain-containing protein 2 n=1 Tax=Leifsonia shinshuensis TaxID=150026 RepID=A0A853CS42_9MICO|nr:amidohydrolase [Leifsonia shinshuensis]
MTELRDLSRPTEPSSSYLDALRDRTAERAARAEALTSPHRGAAPELASAVASAVQERSAAIAALSRRIFGTPEEAFREHHSAAAIAGAVRAEGWDAAVGVFGQPTAVLAQAGRPDGPAIAILAEYDALPGIGHGCGHNIIAASAVGAFLAVASVADRLDGRIVLLGTPAEEGNSGKELLARAGAFDGLDAAIMAHPFGYDAADHPFIGRRILRVHYAGVAAHASATPFMGRNALDAATLHYQAVAQLRQHLPPGDRVHGIVLHGGDRPSIVPASATLEYYLRSHEAATLRELSTRLREISEGVALATGTGVRLEWDPQPYTLPTRFNRPLTERWAVHQEQVGRRVLTRDVVPSELAASTDFGNVSVRVPGIHPVIAVSPPEVALHTEEFARYASSAAGDRAAVDAAHGLALTALDFLTDPALREAAAADFAAAGGRLDVEGYFS